MADTQLQNDHIQRIITKWCYFGHFLQLTHSEKKKRQKHSSQHWNAKIEIQNISIIHLHLLRRKDLSLWWTRITNYTSADRNLSRLCCTIQIWTVIFWWIYSNLFQLIRELLRSINLFNIYLFTQYFKN